MRAGCGYPPTLSRPRSSKRPMITKSVCAAALLLLFAQPLDTGLAAKVDGLVNPEAAANLLGGNILIARGDRIVFQKAYGFANWELRAELSVHSFWRGRQSRWQQSPA
jgi:CubicO group peptidase (beta-lactamase class C family)